MNSFPSSAEDEADESLEDMEEGEEEEKKVEGRGSALVPFTTSSNSVFLLHGDM